MSVMRSLLELAPTMRTRGFVGKLAMAKAFLIGMLRFGAM